MGSLFVKGIRGGIIFFRTCLGVINAPYVTYRAIANGPQNNASVFFVYFLSVLYFIWVTLLKTGYKNPYVLTIHLNILLLGASFGIVLALLTLYMASRFVKGHGSFKALFFLYSYSLLPTILWFFSTSLLYLFFPPPRSESIPGKLFSVMYIAFSIGLIIWKCILYFLTLRFAFKLNLFQFIRVSFLFLPTVVVYAVIMHRFGIFRIPFL